MTLSLGRCRIEESILLFLTISICSFAWMSSNWIVNGFIIVPDVQRISYSQRKTVSLLLSAASDDSVVEGMTLKVAIDRKGNVGDASKDFGRFTSEDSLDMVHRLRSHCQGVLVGRVTVERDDCTLTVRRNVPCQQQPTRLIIDSQLSLLSSSSIPYKALTQSDDAPTVIYHILSNEQATSKFDMWKQNQTDDDKINKHISLISMPTSLEGGRINPMDIWNHISQTLQMKHILIEGGPMTAKLFLPFVDRIILVQANNVEFKNQPIKLNISMDDIYKSHVSIGNTTSATMDDTWYYFSKDGSWPSENTQNWP